MKFKAAGYAGSSPLARGGPKCSPRQSEPYGLIPARAGRTRPSRASPGWSRAHPRSRGADSAWDDVVVVAEGSSPLARGGLEDEATGFAVVGLIPARAGRTHAQCRRRALAGAHPRSRGPDKGELVGMGDVSGSSPLARGGPAEGEVGPDGGGLIPARAGRTWSASSRSPSSRAHPRSRGADTRGSGCAARREGSSPLARGGRSGHQRRCAAVGLIPARAGRTMMPRQWG